MNRITTAITLITLACVPAVHGSDYIKALMAKLNLSGAPKAAQAPVKPQPTQQADAYDKEHRAAKEALKSSGWTSNDTAVKTNYVALQKILRTHAAKLTWDNWLQPEWDALSRARAQAEKNVNLHALLNSYLHAYGELRSIERTSLITSCDYVMSTIVGSAPLTAQTTHTAQIVIRDIRALSYNKHVQQLATILEEILKNRAQSAAPKKSDVDTSAQLARMLQEEENKKKTQLQRDAQLAQSLADADVAKPLAPKKQPQQPKKSTPQEELKKVHAQQADEQVRAAQMVVPSQIKKVQIVWIPVRPQTGATCGLHALNNSHECAHSISIGESNVQLKARMLKPLTGVPELLIPGGNMLNPDQIEHCAEMINIKSGTFCVLQNVQQNAPDLTKAQLVSTVVTPIATRDFRYLDNILETLHTKHTALRTFVLGNMTIDAVTQKGTSGHWIGVTAHKHGDTLTLYAMDSAGGKPEALVQALEQIILKTDYRALRAARNRYKIY